MSCVRPNMVLVPLRGGSPIFLKGCETVERGSIITIKGITGRINFIPCGGCLACRRERRQELTLLQCCEASLHDDNWFITLTYDDLKICELTDSHAPVSLDRSHLSEFNHSMRHHASYCGEKYRFFASGEYGEQNSRAHYHLSVFGISADCLGLPFHQETNRIRKEGINNGKIYRPVEGQYDSEGREYWQSPVVSKFWPYGSHKIYRANRETFQYVAGYVTKKLTGRMARDSKKSGKLPEFQCQSRPSIGFEWFKKYFDSLSNPNGSGKLINDALEIAGTSWKCPRIFSRWLAQFDHFDGEKVVDYLKRLRLADADSVPDLETLQRKARFDCYRAEHYKLNNQHKEIN